MPRRWSGPVKHPPERIVGEHPGESEELSNCPSCGLNWENGQNYCACCEYDSRRSSGAPEIGASAVEPAAASRAAGSVIRRKGGVTWGGGQMIAGIILVLLSLFVSAAVASIIASLYPEQRDAVATWISVHLMALAIVSTIWFLGLRHTRYPLAVLRLSRIRLPRIGTVLLMVGVLATSLIATSIYARIVDWLDVDILSPPVVASDIIFDGPAVFLTFQALAFITPLS